MKQIIERGASWTLEETKLLLVFWGQDLIKRLRSKAKRTKEVYEKISQKFAEHGYERTADQIRTRIFNMIAEYRRILKDPNPERMKKCVFFETVHRLYNAHDMKDVKSAIDEYEPDFPNSPTSNALTSDKGEESISDSESIDGDDTFNNTAASANNNGGSTEDSNLAPNIGNNDTIDEEANQNSNTDKESASASAATTTATCHTEGAPAKKLKLESSKNNQARTNSNQAKESASSATSSSAFAIDNQNASTSKANKTSTSGTPASGQASSGPSNSLPSSTQLSSQRHQSLLLPHATSSSASSSSPSGAATASTPIGKLSTSTAGNTTPSYININSTKLPIIRANQLIGHSNGNESINLNGTTTRLPTTAAITSHQLYQAPVTTFDVTSSALLIDRMFAHLSRESENMREWIALEKERLVLEKSRRQQEIEREAKRERILVDALTRYQDQWLSFMSRLDSSILENITEPLPTLKIPPRESGPITETSQGNQTTNNTSTNNTATNTTALSSANASSNPSGSTTTTPSTSTLESGK